VAKKRTSWSRIAEGWRRDWERPKDWNEGWARYRAGFLEHPEALRRDVKLWVLLVALAIVGVIVTTSLSGRLLECALFLVSIGQLRGTTRQAEDTLACDEPPGWFTRPLWRRLIGW
jgi:hypothetical protein